MKNLAKLIAVAVVSMAPLAFGGVTSYAASTCPSGYTLTGPGSNNVCVSTTTYTCEVTNNNNVDVKNDNKQTVFSGNATSKGNTNGGLSASGNASNDNTVKLDVQIDNKGVCTTTATVPAKTTPTTPATSAKNGNGNGALKQTVPATIHTKANVLPNTSADQTVATIAGIMAVLGGGAVIARLASSTVSHIKR